MNNSKLLIITYYWPPAGGSGVQRWMYFAKYLKQFGYEPLIVTVDEHAGSYKFLDQTLLKEVEGIEVHKTRTFEPLKLYSYLTTGKGNEGIPQGFAGEKNPGLIQQVSRFVRGNFFIPDARVGWNKFARSKAEEIIEKHSIKKIITTGPPHSTHLVGLDLKKKYNLHWIADFRDPWTEVFYNELMMRTKFADEKDSKLEKEVLEKADQVLTIGPSMAELLANKITDKNKVKYVYNGYDEELSKGLVTKAANKQFTITHIGLLSESQPIEPLIKSLKQLIAEKKIDPEKILFKMIGKVSEINTKAIDSIYPQLNYEVVSYLPHKQAIEEMFKSDLLFNSLAETKYSKLLISGKLMEYLSTGNPILVFGDEKSDAAELLKDFEFAEVFDRADQQGIESYLQRIYDGWIKGAELQNNTEKVKQYNRKSLTEKLIKVLDL